MESQCPAVLGDTAGRFLLEIDMAVEDICDCDTCQAWFRKAKLAMKLGVDPRDLTEDQVKAVEYIATKKKQLAERKRDGNG